MLLQDLEDQALVVLQMKHDTEGRLQEKAAAAAQVSADYERKKTEVRLTAINRDPSFGSNLESIAQGRCPDHVHIMPFIKSYVSTLGHTWSALPLPESYQPTCKPLPQSMFATHAYFYTVQSMLPPSSHPH